MIIVDFECRINWYQIIIILSASSLEYWIYKYIIIIITLSAIPTITTTAL